MATLGQALTTPEAGWQRIDDSDENITYVGNWYRYGSPTTPDTVHALNCWKNTYSATQAYGNAENGGLNFGVKFNFVGSKLRIIGYSANNTCQNVEISIDGAKYNFNTKYGTASGIQQCLHFEILSLENKEHFVEMKNITPEQWHIDTIDIDLTGQLKPYKVFKSKFLLHDDNNVKNATVINNVLNTNIINIYPPTENDFLNNGLDDPSLFYQQGDKYIDETVSNGETLESGVLHKYHVKKSDMWNISGFECKDV